MIGFHYRLYLVTDEAACLGRDFFWVIEQALKGGVDLVQLREKSLPADKFIDKAFRLAELCERYDVPLIINDSFEIARAVNAFGLHVGQSDIKLDTVLKISGHHYPVGLSVELPEHLLDKQTEKVWYLGVSPIFATPTKNDTISEWGLEGLHAIRLQSDKPLVAIGNIKSANAADVVRSGADCIAVVSEICSADCPSKAAEILRDIIEKNV
ncbi:thiamine phosphate synthase [Pedobacter frigidisoli]|uniref:thiamine phosphate synthase n=1 Tax=Pedobacter frigidisoli TaxID=2530455 RepID=UPI00293172CE|nr:thiamine phosphate synthase [Pedobacter frigidisoli]